ncbi:MAG: UTP--glucose-1-phosphate uridylyltransferase [Deltaproteobacteria bacterium]|nr:UTP--glucose-1-phosphate uridylyltransferase [Deltaproteobacteria bacterium]
MDNLNIDNETIKILEEYGFNSIPFSDLQKEIRDNGFNPSKGKSKSAIKPLSSDLMTEYPENENETKKAFEAAGKKAIENGEVAVVILNGGMATRFGGVPKGAVEIVNGRTFLDYKISQAKKAGNGKSPVILMNSFATMDATRKHINELNPDIEILDFHQFISLRMTDNGDVFKTDEGAPSLYAPGHGDFPFALKESKILEKLKNLGIKYITLSNVDNLGAGLDPVVIGMHILNKKPMSVELVKTYPGDVGGFPAIENDKDVIMEAFRLPESFDKDSIEVFNTNTFVFNIETLDMAPELTWFMVKKNVGGKSAIQWERLVGQLTQFVEVSWLVVPREGENSRFIPIKTVEDIDINQDILKAVLKKQQIL